MLMPGGDGEERDRLDAVLPKVVFQLLHLGYRQRVEELLIALAQGLIPEDPRRIAVSYPDALQAMIPPYALF
ncbi:MAG: hypothetical protein HY316_08560 [Acidobacteria bacterium]|nr:hypothetical protein [Acidobacteriota bacterium]